MRALFTLAGAIVATAVPAYAQTSEIHPADPLAQYLGAYRASTDVVLSQTTRATQIGEEIIVWKTSAGIELVGNVTSISCSAECGDLDPLLTSRIADLLSEEAVKRSMEIGYVVPSPCDAPLSIKVLQCDCAAEPVEEISRTPTSCIRIQTSERTYTVCWGSTPRPTCAPAHTGPTGCSDEGRGIAVLVSSAGMVLPPTATYRRAAAGGTPADPPSAGTLRSAPSRSGSRRMSPSPAGDTDGYSGSEVAEWHHDEHPCGNTIHHPASTFTHFGEVS